jgi:hypothetical protein
MLHRLRITLRFGLCIRQGALRASFAVFCIRRRIHWCTCARIAAILPPAGSYAAHPLGPFALVGSPRECCRRQAPVAEPAATRRPVDHVVLDLRPLLPREPLAPAPQTGILPDRSRLPPVEVEQHAHARPLVAPSRTPIASP